MIVWKTICKKLRLRSANGRVIYALRQSPTGLVIFQRKTSDTQCRSGWKVWKDRVTHKMPKRLKKFEQIEWHIHTMPKRLRKVNWLSDTFTQCRSGSEKWIYWVTQCRSGSEKLNRSSNTLVQCRRGDWNTEPQSVNVLKNTERKKRVR